MDVIKTENAAANPVAFQSLISQWFSTRGGKSLPALEDYLSLPDHLGTYRIIAKITGELSVVYESVGESIERLYGAPMSGKNLDELYNDWFRKQAYTGYKKVIKEKFPVYERRSFATIIRPIGYHKMLLPFGDDAVTAVAAYIMPTDKKIHRRSHWEDIIKKTPWFGGE